MSATKTVPESQDKAPAAPVIAKQPETPEKATGPQHVTQSATAPAASQPNDAASVMRSAEMVANPEGGAGAAVRARTMMTLQRRVGNNRVSNLVGGIQTKLTVGAVDDPHEREADRVAEAIPQQAESKPASPVLRQFVMKHALSPAGSAQRQVRTEDEKEEQDKTADANPIQRAATNEADHGNVEADMERRIAAPSGGQPLPEGLQRDMESNLGADFSQVRVHDNSEDQADARRLNAKAFTHGEHIWLGAGESANDRKLMAHELTHVVQQGGGEVRRQPLDAAEDAEERIPDAEISSPELTESATPELIAPALPVNAPERSEAATEPATEIAVPEREPETELGPPDTAAAPNLPPEPPTESGNLTTAFPEPAAPEETPAEAPAGTEFSFEGESLALESEATGASEGVGTIEVATKPITSDIALSASPSSSFIQRDEDDGILASIRRRIRGVVDGLRSGWDSLTTMAASAFENIRSTIGGLLDGLRNMINSALTAVQTAWSGLVSRVQQLADGVKRLVQAGVTAVMGAARAIGTAIIRLDPLGLSNAWARLTSIVSGLNQRVQQALQVVFGAIAGLWQGLRARFDALVERLTAGASALRERALSMVQGLGSLVASAWQSLRARAQQLSGVLGEVLDTLRSLLSSLLEWGQQIWGRIQEGFAALSSRLAAFIERVLQGVTSAWQALRQRATAFWARLQPLWERLKQSVSRFLERLASAVREVWGRLVSLGIGAFLSFLQGLRDVYQGMVQIYEDVRGFLEPIAARVTDMVFAAMPQKALEYASGQIAQVLGAPAVAAPEPAPEESESEGTAVDTKVQRVPRDTATFGEIGTGFLTAITTIWRRLTWSAFLDMVLDALLEQLFPPLAVYRQLRDFIFQDLAAIGRGLYMPRNILSDPAGALHDIWTNLYHLIVDTLLSLLRRLVNILMAFQLWITIILTVLGAIGGSVVVGILGGILAGLATVGIGAGVGAAGGAAAGGAAGAGVGFGVSLLIGEAVFFAFLILHGTTIVATLVDLKTTLQTRQEKERDYAQLAESAIAVGVGLALLLLAWLAGTVAKGAAALIERLGLKVRIPLPPSVSRFLRGIKSTRPPGRRGLSTEEQAARLAAEQRLSRLVGGDLARSLVADLGPLLAEEVVAKLGPASVRTLATELTPEAIALVARDLTGDVVERLLSGEMSPKKIHTAVVAGQAERLTALTAEQITKLAALTDEGFTRIVGLSDDLFTRFVGLDPPQLRFFAGLEEAQFARFAGLDDGAFARFRTMDLPQLGAFAEMTDAQFGRFTALDDAAFARFRTLTPGQLKAFAGMADDAFARYRGLSNTDFAKFAGFPPDTLVKFGNLSDAAFARYAALNQPDLAKFVNVTQPSLERLAGLPAGELEVMATTMSEADIHAQVLGRDPAVGRFRPTEAATALRVEAKRGITLDRFIPSGPTEKGDWVDIATGEVYDGCSPPQSRFFDQQIANGNYERSLIEHVNHPTVDRVVIDTTGLGLTPAQEATLQTVIDRVAGVGSPKIVRIP